jgi:hypothetical protein
MHHLDDSHVGRSCAVTKMFAAFDNPYNCSVRGLNICGCANDANLGVVSCAVCAHVVYVNDRL